ncbi:MAG: polyprenol monophosphomannose synthase [Myxococcota bacterium]|nr:polyprenol monophosphomannose synthase [Myxococcota bacterium]
MDAHPLVIVPTFNEADNIIGLVEAVHGALPSAHILVVDDGSPDGTGEIVDGLRDTRDWLHVMHRTEKAGLGRAYLAGFEWALDRHYTHIFEMDADFSHPPDRLATLLEATRYVDVALGSRWCPGGGTDGWPMWRRFMSRGGSLYARTILGVAVADLTGGFKCFRRVVLETLDLSNIQTVGYGFQIELTWRAIQAGFTVSEVPINFVDRVAGKSKMSGDIFREALLLVWKLRLKG